MREILKEMIEYIEETEQTIDGEWGIGRNIKELLEQNVMPDLYYNLLEMLKRVDAQ